MSIEAEDNKKLARGFNKRFSDAMSATLETYSNPDDPFLLTAEGVLSFRDLVREVQALTPVGKRQIRAMRRLALHYGDYSGDITIGKMTPIKK